MRIITVTITAIAICVSSAWCQSQNYVIPIKKDVPVFLNETRKVYEKPSFFLNENERFMVKTTGKAMIEIANFEGKTGWVEASSVKTVPKNQLFKYNETEVTGYIDEPTIIWVAGKDEAIEKVLSLNRSFANELIENIDEETIIRQTTF